MTEAARWTVRLSKATDSDVRSYLAEHGRKRGDLSKFVERAVQRELLRVTVRDIRQCNTDIPADELQTIIDQACATVRKEFWKDRKGWTDEATE
jgi:hypothetical protein